LTGWYKLTIIDDSAASTGEGKVYFPPQVVYVYLD